MPTDASDPHSSASSGEQSLPDASPQSGAPGEDIPLQGTHQGDTDDPVTSSVRGQEPPDPTPGAEHVEEEEPDVEDDEGASPEGASSDRPDDLGTYQLSHDPETGRHRVRLRPPAEETPSPSRDFQELSRHSSPQEMSEALGERLPDGPRYVVLENTETGETHFDRQGELSGGWFSEGRFDQVTVFDSEDEAAAYADEQQ